jgi:hypothetical protein
MIFRSFTTYKSGKFLSFICINNKISVFYTIILTIWLAMDATAITTAPADEGQLPGADSKEPKTDNASNTTPPGDLSILGKSYKQCSNARMAASNLTYTEIVDGKCTTSTAQTPMIGKLDWEDDQTATKTFHGGRVTKSGRTVNECLSSSFDPRNLHCVSCESAHHILSPLKPPVLIFADQNFVPHLSGGPDNCIAVVRAENTSLNELADLAAEILEKIILPHGSVILFGSGSHLFRVGPSQYASDWIHLRNRCSQKWSGSTIGPLIPIIRSDCPGSLARDISVLAAWLGRVYADNATGMIDTWNTLLKITEAQCEGSQSTEICKLPLPTSVSVGSVQTHCFIFHNSCPVTLKGVDRKATEELTRVLINCLNRDFNTNVNPEIVIANSWAGSGTEPDPSDNMDATGLTNHVVLIGASNMRRLIPFLKSNGHSVTDLTQSSWLATPDNIDHIIAKLNTISPDSSTTVILELYGNSTYRYRQFDGTMALPYKLNNGYHMEGEVGVCDTETFVRLCGTTSGIYEACKDSIKIVIPPLPRYLYTSCCGNKRHCTNRANDDYTLSLLQATTHFRPLLKDALLRQGTENFFVLDGIGALLGILPGENRGAPSEIIKDLEKYCAADGVHYSEPGYANFAKTAMAASTGIANGSLTKSALKNPKNANFAGQTYFWRGFTSPVGARLAAPATGGHTSFRIDPTPRAQPPCRGGPWRGDRDPPRGRGGRGKGDRRGGGGRGSGNRGGGHHPYYHPYSYKY